MKTLILIITISIFTCIYAQDESVSQEWVSYYGGTGNGNFVPCKVKTDLSGNVIVTGYGWNGSNYDFATIKYNSSGSQQWLAVFDYNNNFDKVSDLAVDPFGNVYVTGYSIWQTGYCRIATVKYNSSGVQQWAKISDELLSDCQMSPIYIGLDGSQNVYVTGPGCSPYEPCYPNPFCICANSDILLIKYNSNGVKQYATTYGNPTHGGDNPTGIAVSYSGILWIIATSEYWTCPFTCNTKYTTIRVAQNGTIEWARTYDGPKTNGYDIPTSITILDANQYSFVTGKSQGTNSGYDIATVMYDSQGDESWVKRYDGSASDDDFSNQIAMDPLHNVYVTGYSNRLQIDGTTYKDYVTIKYNLTGIQQWVSFYNCGIEDDDIATSLAIEGSYPYSVYVTGYSYECGIGGDVDVHFTDYATIKYNSSNGSQIWAIRFNGPTYQNDVANSIALYGSSNPAIYVTGYTGYLNSPSGTQYATVKYTQTAGPDTKNNNTVLNQNSPNPFNPITKISFNLEHKQHVKLSVYDILGREVAVLVNQELDAGKHAIDWNANSFPSGVYLYKLLTDDYSEVKRMVLIK